DPMRDLKGHKGKLRSAVYSPDGTRLASAGDDSLTTLCDAATGRELATLHQPEAKQRVRYIAFSPDGKLLATATGRVRVWDLDTLSEVPFPDLGETHEGLALAFTPDGALLVVTHWFGFRPR